jgi:hypothetical protein
MLTLPRYQWTTDDRGRSWPDIPAMHEDSDSSAQGATRNPTMRSCSYPRAPSELPSTLVFALLGLLGIAGIAFGVAHLLQNDHSAAMKGILSEGGGVLLVLFGLGCLLLGSTQILRSARIKH